MNFSDLVQNIAPRSGGVRFAPSPTGHFHLGNLRSAWISHEIARRLGLPWVLRFEDIDKPRVQPWAQESQLRDMRALGLEPDLVLVQSQFEERHWELFERARASGQVYACDCSRKDVQTALAGLASAPHGESAPIYSGHCRLLAPDRAMKNAESIAWRFRMPDKSGANDFIIARTSEKGERASFVPAYHWACAIDDSDGGYEILVRSADLRTAAPVQRAIQKWMAPELLPPTIFHTALIVDNSGHRLEKRTRGVTLEDLAATQMLPAKILKLFASSVNESSFNREILNTIDGGEPVATLSLHDLGF